MSIQSAAELMTADEFLAIPDDGIDRELVRGVVVERGRTEMTRRNRRHAAAEAAVARILGNWVHESSPVRGRVLSGEVGCILRGEPDNVVGIDVVFITAEHAAQQTDETTMIDGPPLLAVEILSPSDKQEDIGRKIDDYLRHGVQLVWIIDTHFQTVTVHQPECPPELFNSSQVLESPDRLPGLQIQVAQLFS